VLFEPLKSGKRSVKHLSSEMQVTAVELQVSENCLKNWQILQAAFPAYHCTVKFQTASRLFTKRAKKMFEKHKLMIKAYLGDFLKFLANAQIVKIFIGSERTTKTKAIEALAM
jgi:hypothetical protein